MRNERRCCFLKIYSPDRSQDAVLSRCLLPLPRAPAGVPWRCFFFVRYWDPRPHLRVRFLYEKSVPSGPVDRAVRDALRRRLAAARVPGRIRGSVYRPEYARYGGKAGMLVAESVFQASSLFVLSCLASRRAAARRAEIAAASAQMILDAFGAAVSRGARRRGSAPGKRLAGLFADLRNELRRDAARFIRASRPDLKAPVAAFAAALADADAKLRGLRRSATGLDWERIVSSYVHMHFNRFGIPRTQESLLHHLLSLRNIRGAA